MQTVNAPRYSEAINTVEKEMLGHACRDGITSSAVIWRQIQCSTYCPCFLLVSILMAPMASSLSCVRTTLCLESEALSTGEEPYSRTPADKQECLTKDIERL